MASFPTSRRGLLIALPLASVGLSLGSPARAQLRTSYHATGAVTNGVDTNINAVAEGDEVTGGPIAGYFLQATPGFALFADSPRMRFGLTLLNTFLIYIGNPEFNTTGQDLNTALVYALSPTEELSVTAGWSRFSTNTVTLLGASSTNVQAQPQGDAVLNTFSASQGYSVELSPDFRFLQGSSTSFSFDESDDPQPPLFTLGANFGPEFVVESRHGLAVLPDVQWSKPFGGDQDVEAIGFNVTEQLIVTLPARWRWDFALEWSSELSGGGAMTLARGQEPLFAPVGTAGIFFARDEYSAGAQYSRSVSPDPTTGQVFTVDSWALQGQVPIWTKYNLSLQTSSGFALNDVVGAVDENEQPLDLGIVKTVVVDAAVAWSPRQMPSVELRYQHFTQFDAPPNQQVLPNYDRDVVSLLVTFMYPPPEVQFPEGQPRRLDGEDRDDTLFGADERERNNQRRLQSR